MAIRKILLPLTGTAAGEAALATALMIARRWNAHVLALHVRVDSRDVAPLAGEGLSGAMIEEMMSATEKESSDRAHAVRTMFEQDIVAQQARLADLTIVPHPESGDDVSSSDALHAVLFDSGRPVMIAPQTVPTTVGARVCLAWNGTAESASSVTAAMDWLHRAEACAILTAEGYQRRGPGAPDLAAYLALHGIAAEIITFKAVNGSVGAGLLAAASGFRCDMLSMGAYSHSRLRQLILGGVTRHVLENSSLAVMMNR
jgi:nucleotide-binding universal stress UspA family protein